MPEESANGGWFKAPNDIPRNLAQKGLEPFDVCLLWWLMGRMNKITKITKVDQGEEYIAESLGVSPRTVKRGVFRLRAAGLLETKRRQRPEPQVYLFPCSPDFRSDTTGTSATRSDTGGTSEVRSDTQGTSKAPEQFRSDTGDRSEVTPVAPDRQDSGIKTPDSGTVADVGTEAAAGDENEPAPDPFAALPEPVREAAHTLQEWPAWRLSPAQTVRRLAINLRDFPTLDLAKEAVACSQHYTAAGNVTRNGRAVNGPSDWERWLEREERERVSGGNGKAGNNGPVPYTPSPDFMAECIAAQRQIEEARR